MPPRGPGASHVPQRAPTSTPGVCPAFPRRATLNGPHRALPLWVIVGHCLIALRSLEARMTSIFLKGWAFLLALLFAASVCPAQTAGVPLTLPQAIALARAKNP